MEQPRVHKNATYFYGTFQIASEAWKRSSLRETLKRAAYADGLARGRSPSRSRARVGEDIHLEESQLPASQVSLPATTRLSLSVPASLERVTFARWSVRAAVRRAAVARSRVIGPPSRLPFCGGAKDRGASSAGRVPLLKCASDTRCPRKPETRDEWTELATAPW